MPPRDARLSSFGEDPTPPPAPAEPEARTVTDVLQAANRAIWEKPELLDVWVRGEISNLTMHPSGHWYFRLKDDRSLLDAAMFRLENQRVQFQPEEGMEVLARGRIGVYNARSSLQLVVQELRPVGIGALQIAFDQLRRKLDAEGLFRRERKRTIPAHPRTIGVVTSLQGAVLRDIIRTATRRNPAVRIVVAGARVQGVGAADEVARAIAALNRDGSPDVLIVGRGGGSMEDLWAFNEESLVRAVVASRIPIISAVGHETDFTLCDFAADLRASTPTAAAERATPDAQQLALRVATAEKRLHRALADLIPNLRHVVDDRFERARVAMRRFLDAEKRLMEGRVARLDSLSPLRTLARGYAVVRRDGRVVRAPADAPVGSDVEIILDQGRMDAKVTKHVEDE